MKSISKLSKIIIIFLIIIIVNSCNKSTDKKINTSSTEDKIAIKVETKEIKRFWSIFDKPKTVRDSLYKEMVLDSIEAPGIHRFYKMTFDGYPEAYSIYIDKYTDFYKTIKETTLQVDKSDLDSIDYYFNKFKNIYPEANDVRVDLTLGIFSVGGGATNNSLVIGLENYMKKFVDSVNTDSFIYGRQLSIDMISPILVHEQMHLEQNKNDFLKGKTLLERCLHEGSADFVSNLITKSNDKEEKYIYGRLNENKLWDEFQKEMYGEDLSNWLFNYNEIQGRPNDLGYFMGHQICKSYYENMDDKKQAIKDILSIKDATQFLENSKYVAKFINE